MTAREPDRARRRGLTFLAIVAGLAMGSWEAPVAAYMGYPAVVDTALGVPQIVEMTIAPKMGCQLCHTSPTGATADLTAFPSYLIYQFGFQKTSAEEDSLLVAGLAKLEAAEPKLWADMKAGKDPNVDPNLTALAPPQPQYGCSMGRAPSGPQSGWAAALGLAIVTLSRRRRSPHQRARLLAAAEFVGADRSLHCRRRRLGRGGFGCCC
jgi:MYXO-CTERM domain-containing protein